MKVTETVATWQPSVTTQDPIPEGVYGDTRYVSDHAVIISRTETEWVIITSDDASILDSFFRSYSMRGFNPDIAAAAAEEELRIMRANEAAVTEWLKNGPKQ